MMKKENPNPDFIALEKEILDFCKRMIALRIEKEKPKRPKV